MKKMMRPLKFPSMRMQQLAKELNGTKSNKTYYWLAVGFLVLTIIYYTVQLMVE